MIKISRLLKRAPDMSQEMFAARWRDAHDSRVAALVKGTGALAYAQNHAIASDSPMANGRVSPFDGVEDYYFETLDAARQFAWQDGDAFVDATASSVVVGTMHLMWDRPPAPQDDAVKMIFMPVRSAGSTPEDFRHHWMKIHSPLSLDGPGARDRLQRVEFCTSDVIGLTGLEPATIEGTGAIWFDSVTHLRAEFNSDYYRTTLKPDEPRFTDGSRSRGMMVRVPLRWDRDPRA